jgi:3-methyladenine DNA glycosylase AlkD
MSDRRSLNRLRHELRKVADHALVPRLEVALQVRPQGYGEGDALLGVRVPSAREIAHDFEYLELDDAVELLRSAIHEERLVALLILVRQFEIGDDKLRQRIFSLYVDNIDHVDNWDLVDTSAPAIVGAHLLDRPRDVLRRWAKSSSLWERRIAIISTLTFIRAGDFDETLRLSNLLLHDDHDLIHKAVGWMLREVGKRDEGRLIEFLERHAKETPRVVLRYATERLEPAQRSRLLLLGP